MDGTFQFVHFNSVNRVDGTFQFSTFQFNERHGRNRLGEAHPRTWRMLVTKVAARIIVSTRRVRVLLSASWPNVPYLRRATVAVESFVPH